MRNVLPLIQPYVDGLTQADTHAGLIAHLIGYGDVAPDALEAAPTEAEFGWFREGLLQERAGVFAGTEWEDRFTNVLIPSAMFAATVQ